MIKLIGFIFIIIGIISAFWIPIITNYFTSQDFRDKVNLMSDDDISDEIKREIDSLEYKSFNKPMSISALLIGTLFLIFG